MLFKLSNLNSNLSLTLGYLNPALNNSAMGCTVKTRFSDTRLINTHTSIYIMNNFACPWGNKALIFAVSPLSPNILIQILHTDIHTFP